MTTVEESTTQDVSSETASGAQEKIEISVSSAVTTNATEPLAPIQAPVQTPSEEPAQEISTVPADEAVIPDEPSNDSTQEDAPATEGTQTPSGVDDGETEAPSTTDVSVETEGEPSGEDSAESTGTETAPESSALADLTSGATGGTEPAVPVTQEGVATEVSQSVEEPAATEAPTEKVSESASATDIEALTSFEDVLDGIEMPAGSEQWNDKQWNEFLQTADGQKFTERVMTALSETEEFGVVIDILTDFIDTEDLGYLDELQDYLLYLFDGNEEWAMEAYNGVISELRAQGYELEDWTIEQEPAESTPPAEPSEKPKPTVKPETKPVIKPAGIVKPVVDKKPIVEAIAKPAVQAKTEKLAETGSDGTVLLAGAGMLLVVGGVFALRLRRKPRAH